MEKKVPICYRFWKIRSAKMVNVINVGVLKFDNTTTLTAAI